MVANYLRGIAILLDQSVRFGDAATVDGFHGEVRKMTSRRIIVRGTELETALRLLRKAAAKNADVLKSPANAPVLHAFAGSGIKLELQAWTGNPQQKLAVQTELNLSICRSFSRTK